MRSLIGNITGLDRDIVGKLSLHIEVPGLGIGDCVIRAARRGRRSCDYIKQRLAQKVVREVSMGKYTRLRRGTGVAAVGTSLLIT